MCSCMLLCLWIAMCSFRAYETWTWLTTLVNLEKIQWETGYILKERTRNQQSSQPNEHKEYMLCLKKYIRVRHKST